jgi:transcriptional regulator with XRE-family HTH domain
MVERILALIKEKGITANKLTADLGLSVSAVTDWKNGKAKPSYGALVKIASYFGVTTEYLEGKTDEPRTKLPDGLSYSFMSGYREIDENDRAELNRMLDRMLELKRLREKTNENKLP